jgi:hypothetical protein
MPGINLQNALPAGYGRHAGQRMLALAAQVPHNCALIIIRTHSTGWCRVRIEELLVVKTSCWLASNSVLSFIGATYEI